MSNRGKLQAFAVLVLMTAGGFLAGCKSAPELTADQAKTLIQAKYTKNRQRLLEQANLTLEVLRFQMRLAKDLQCLKVNSYGFAGKAIDEIGRLVGGWLRSRPEETEA